MLAVSKFTWYFPRTVSTSAKLSEAAEILMRTHSPEDARASGGLGEGRSLCTARLAVFCSGKAQENAASKHKKTASCQADPKDCVRRRRTGS